MNDYTTSIYAYRKMHKRAREICMIMNKDIQARTPKPVMVKFIREYLGMEHGSDDSVVEFFVEQLRTAYASSDRLVSVRPYKMDMAMRQAASRVAGLPVPVTIGGRGV